MRKTEKTKGAPKKEASQAAVPKIRQLEGPVGEWVRIDELVPYDKNPRQNDAAVPAVIESIKAFGFGAPLVARRANKMVIAGHTRLRAAQALGLEKVPVRFIDVSDKEARALAIVDNKTNELAGWVDDLLGPELRHLGTDFDFASLGFSGLELQSYIEEGKAPNGGSAQQDDVPIDRADELQKKWKTATGQLWQVGGHKLLVGDCTDGDLVAKLFAGKKADWMWTDPPYGVSYESKPTKTAKQTIANDASSGLGVLLDKAFAMADRVLREGAPIYVAHPSGPNSVVFGVAFAAVKAWRFHEILIWCKDSMVLGHSDYHYKHEPIIYGWKGKNRTWKGGRDKVSLLEFPKPPKADLHPTMKPVPLVGHCIENSSELSSIGYEPFSGSGTTLVAAAQLGRRVFAMELLPKFGAVALERLAVLGEKPKLLR